VLQSSLLKYKRRLKQRDSLPLNAARGAEGSEVPMWSRDKAPVVGLGDFIPQKLKLFAHLHIIFCIFCPMRDFFAGQMGEDGPMVNTLVSPQPILLLPSAPFRPLSPESGGSRGPPAC